MAIIVAMCIYRYFLYIRAKLYSRLKNFTGNTISVSGYC